MDEQGNGADQAEELYYEATSKLKQGDRGQAMQLLEKALKVHPRHPWANCTYGLLLEEDGLIDRAESHLRRAVTNTDEKDSVILNNLAAFFFRQGHYGDAEKWYLKTLEARDAPIYHWGLAKSLENLGRTDEAVDHYRRSLEIPYNFQRRVNVLGLGQIPTIDGWAIDAIERIAVLARGMAKDLAWYPKWWERAALFVLGLSMIIVAVVLDIGTEASDTLVLTVCGAGTLTVVMAILYPLLGRTSSLRIPGGGRIDFHPRSVLINPDAEAKSVSK